MSKPVFLTAEWRKLIMINYVIDPKILEPYLPKGLELDFFQNETFVSLVGFLFEDVRVKGIKIPNHVNFEEVNLRFYVKYNDPKVGWKRGVVFIKEIVPKPAISIVANTIYKEPYQSLPMKHNWEITDQALTIEYSWKQKGNWHSFSIDAHNLPTSMEPGSEEEFIAEHYWGYTRKSPNKTAEYEVKHPSWDIYPVKETKVNVNFEAVYGGPFKFLNNTSPSSAFLAEGSEVSVHSGTSIL